MPQQSFAGDPKDGFGRGTDVVWNVQALRAFAALLVVLVHATSRHISVDDIAAHERPWLWPFLYMGLSGVDLFFVISGFIMLVTNWTAFAQPGAGVRFFVRRAIRIYPPYWFALVPVLVVLLVARDQFMLSHVGVSTGILQSLLLLPQQGHFVLAVAWTLVWEMIFYVVFAVLVGLDRRSVPMALAVWFLAQLALYATVRDAPNFYVRFASVPLPIEFIGGAAVGLMYVRGWFPAPKVLAAAALVATAAGWAFVVARHLELDPANLSRVVAFGIPAMLTVWAAVSLEARGVLRAPLALVALGDASYAIYLWHLSILSVMRHLFVRLHPSGPFAHAVMIALTLAVIIAGSMAVYRFFERPVTSALNRLVRRYWVRSPSPVATAVMPRVAAEAVGDA